MMGIGVMEMLILAVCALAGIAGLAGIGVLIWYTSRNKNNSSSQENES